jgi:hypothetical protein
MKSALSFIFVSMFIAQIQAAEVLSCQTLREGPTSPYIKMSLDKDDNSNFTATVAAFNRTSKDVVETFVKAKLDTCEFYYTRDNGKYFNCYKLDLATGMKTFMISNVYTVENNLGTARINSPRKTYRVEMAANQDDKSIDMAKYKEIIGTSSFMPAANCQ